MTDAFEEEAEPTVSIGEYLKDVEEQELEADLVLGGDEGKECTYNNGYMKRQAIFSCLTCTPDGNAGVCTACSLSCHDGHEIVELWTKRNFRCDCGNSKFGEFFCKLLASKDVENPQNLYNHNFRGLYCTCGRPYPDPDAEEQPEMIQCCVCEDWFHEEHLGLESSDMVPRDEEGEPIYEEFICQGCASVCSFLMLYPPTVFASVPPKNATSSLKEKEVAENVPLSSEETNNASSSQDTLMTNASKEELSLGKGIHEENDGKTTTTNHCNGVAGSSEKCVLGLNLSEAVAKLEKSKPMFLCKNWREVLCKCQNCVDFYNQKGVGYLLDPEDTIAEYEAMAKQKREELEQQQSSEFLNKLGHIEKIEILTGIADIKNELSSYLASFDPSKAVTSADIHQVFENLAKKRKRME
ncbi:PREDICTED: putative E3 ubiquitin-protein ligase UBR7 isoform X2 [Ipomoea nil]|uniref:putative E3 ubiquitin-protein ligase UBR7 isoform X2 n=1 Tax=Ipomoea nil TaxID=35883 RepID=UPI000900E0FD|nr:PREDICTED: putative E3 ubiquitin-protein ligase UBR7 isoform X2 [Ipomoea nil]